MIHSKDSNNLTIIFNSFYRRPVFDGKTGMLPPLSQVKIQGKRVASVGDINNNEGDLNSPPV